MPKRETLSINKLYKTLLLILIVVGPIYWLMFTTDGKRRTDTMVLWLFSGESIELNFDVLDRDFSEQDWKTVYPEVEWQCKGSQSASGSRVCISEIASYNGIPSSYLSVFFDDQSATREVKLVYRNQYHSDIGEDLMHQLGSPPSGAIADPSITDSERILQWKTSGGRVLIKQKLQRDEEPVLLWLADPD